MWNSCRNTKLGLIPEVLFVVIVSGWSLRINLGLNGEIPGPRPTEWKNLISYVNSLGNLMETFYVFFN